MTMFQKMKQLNLPVQVGNTTRGQQVNDIKLIGSKHKCIYNRTCFPYDY
jgi:hypothetical protein